MGDFAAPAPITPRTWISVLVLSSCAVFSTYWPIRLVAVVSLLLRAAQRLAPNSRLVRFLWRRRPATATPTATLPRPARIPIPTQPTFSQADADDPTLKIAGFRLWVRGRQFPQMNDYYDGNWLHVRAVCADEQASVTAEGNFLMAQDILSFGEQLHRLYVGEIRKAVLDPLEPNLKVEIEPTDQLGHVIMRVTITPNHLTQAHRMAFHIDQSYLPELVAQCEVFAALYPLKGE